MSALRAVLFTFYVIIDCYVLPLDESEVDMGFDPFLEGCSVPFEFIFAFTFLEALPVVF